LNAGIKNKGFTLAEILVVILLFSVFIGATYSLYIAHMKTALTQEEVVDTQQNLRIAMNAITRDVAMAGFLAPSTLNTTTGFNNHSSVVNLAMASADKIYVRVSHSSAGTYTVAQTDSLQRITINDIVRCISPEKTTKGDDSIFKVEAVDKNTIQLRGFSSAPPGVGDVLCKIDPPPPAPGYILFETVTYAVSVDPAICGAGVKCIVRRINPTSSTSPEAVRQEVIAQIGSSAPGDAGRVRFSYLLDDGREINSIPDANAAELVRAIRVTVTGQTLKRPDHGEAKTRQMTSIIRVRNRRGP